MTPLPPKFSSLTFHEPPNHYPQPYCACPHLTSFTSYLASLTSSWPQLPVNSSSVTPYEPVCLHIFPNWPCMMPTILSHTVLVFIYFIHTHWPHHDPNFFQINLLWPCIFPFATIIFLLPFMTSLTVVFGSWSSCDLTYFSHTLIHPLMATIDCEFTSVIPYILICLQIFPPYLLHDPHYLQPDSPWPSCLNTHSCWPLNDSICL